jgi:hypothetical protein
MVNSAAFAERLHYSGPDQQRSVRLVRFGHRARHFGNLIYLKGTLDCLLWYHINAAISPGWRERTNRRLQKEQGRTIIGYTPGGSAAYLPFSRSLQ